MVHPRPLSSRRIAALLGLAVGDALGTTVEFHRPGSFPPVTDLTGGGPFHLPAGAWTDDTSMALCLAESLIERQGFDPHDQMRRYVRWWREGHLSSTGRCFDIGNTVRDALARFERTGHPFAGLAGEHTAGNGSLMRLAPIAICFAGDPAATIRFAGESSRTTHGAPQAVDACRYFAGLLVGALSGTSKDELLAPFYSPVPGLWEREPLHPAIAAIAGGSFRARVPDELPASGYVAHTLEAALWAFASTESFEAGALRAVNLGNDADTTGAVFGQIAGAHYGFDAIPARWRERIVMRERIEEMATRLAMPAARNESVRDAPHSPPRGRE